MGIIWGAILGNMSLLLTVVIFLFIFLLIVGADMVVVGLRKVARSTHAGVFTLSAILFALATSFPELSVAITSGLSGNSSLSLGNVLGANIAGVTLVGGSAALIAGRAILRGDILGREVFVALIAGVMPFILGFDGTITRIDGLLLILMWGVYVVHFFRIRFLQVARHVRKEGFWYRMLHRVHIGGPGRSTVHLLVGIAILLFSADMIRRLSQILAHDAGLPLLLIGVLIVAIGTTLPELAFSFRSLFAGEGSMFFGNLLGSIIVNSTLVVGVASLLSPITVLTSSVGILSGAFIVVFTIFWFFVRSSHKLDRKEALILLGLYIIFVLLVTAHAA